MAKLVINSFKEFEQYMRKALGVWDYIKIDQNRINKFAEATLDHQWIHTDTKKSCNRKPLQKDHCARVPGDVSCPLSVESDRRN